MPTEANAAAPYRSRSLPIDQRVTDLLGRMTLEEKAAQMTCVWNEKADKLLDAEGNFDIEKARPHFGHGHGLGQVGRPSDAGGGKGARQMAELTNAIQRFFVEESRLGIPVVFHEECLHGQAAIDGTSFPQPIGLGATFDPELVRRLFAMTAEEARSRGTHQALTPVVDVARDPRWGRVEETYGEDPYLVAQLGVAAVQGFQGDATFNDAVVRGSPQGVVRGSPVADPQWRDPAPNVARSRHGGSTTPDPPQQLADKRHVIATLKHFAAHGQPESGNNCAPVNVSERILRETFFEPFRAALHAGGAMSVMASYNEIDGVPSHANCWLLRDVLRGEWGFTGYVVSDYYAIRELAERPELYGHHVARDGKEAALLAVRAGVNIELPEPDCYKHLVELVREGTLAESKLDELVAPMLAAKFRLGLFDDPYVDPDAAERIVGSDANRQLALEAARKTITLLKNDEFRMTNDEREINSLFDIRHSSFPRILPLDATSIQRLAVIGPNADRELLGGYSGKPKHCSTVLEGIRDYLANVGAATSVGGDSVADQIEILYHEGCKITVGGGWWIDEVVPSDPDEDRRSIAEAVKVADRADVIVLAVGGNEQTSREAWMAGHLGDRTNLDLVGRQDELIDALAATGKPIVALVFGGRPLSINNLIEKAAAIFQCWYLGQETGRAVAEAIFGDLNPGGKLPITIPRSVGHIPAYYNYRPSARRGYLFDEVTPLYPFGFGLSYTTFEFSPPRLEQTTIARDERTRVLVDVTNTGPRRGDEVVQLYIRDLVSSITRPVKELKGFQRITLEPGQSRTVTLDVTPDHLAFWNIDRQRVVEPGDFTIMTGPNSVDLKSTTLTVE